MFNSTTVVNGLRKNVNFVSFVDRDTLLQSGARINMRLRDMLHDPAIIDTNSAERAFRSVYKDVYQFIRETMFNDKGEVVWTFAGQLERAGFSVSRATNGLNLKVGLHTVNIPSPIEPDYLRIADIEWMSALIHAGDVRHV